MRLLEVFFVAPVTVPGYQATAHVRASMVNVLEYDAASRMVLVGEDEYPRERVDHWKRLRRGEPPQIKPMCELCERPFNDARALGAHQRHKHGVKGQSRGNGA